MSLYAVIPDFDGRTTRRSEFTSAGVPFRPFCRQNPRQLAFYGLTPGALKQESCTNGTYLRTVDSILDRKLVTSANLKVVAPAQAGVKCCLGCDASKIGPWPSPGRQKIPASQCIGYHFSTQVSAIRTLHRDRPGHARFFINCSCSRFQSFSFSTSRLSCCFLPLARPISSFTKPPLKCRLSGTSV